MGSHSNEFCDHTNSVLGGTLQMVASQVERIIVIYFEYIG